MTNTSTNSNVNLNTLTKAQLLEMLAQAQAQATQAQAKLDAQAQMSAEDLQAQADAKRAQEKEANEKLIEKFDTHFEVLYTQAKKELYAQIESELSLIRECIIQDFNINNNCDIESITSTMKKKRASTFSKKMKDAGFEQKTHDTERVTKEELITLLEEMKTEFTTHVITYETRDTKYSKRFFIEIDGKPLYKTRDSIVKNHVYKNKLVEYINQFRAEAQTQK